MAGDEGIWALSLADFREATASRQPTPGCGPAAAVVADIGLALVLKALRISEARRSKAQRARLVEDAQALLGRPGAFADEDVQAFRDFLAANRDGHPSERQAASRQACAVPLATAHACLQALGMAVEALPLVAKAVRSDVQAGALLIHAGLGAALINVDADLPAIPDEAERAQLGQTRQRLQEEADQRLKTLQAQRLP